MTVVLCRTTTITKLSAKVCRNPDTHTLIHAYQAIVHLSVLWRGLETYLYSWANNRQSLYCLIHSPLGGEDHPLKANNTPSPRLVV